MTEQQYREKFGPVVVAFTSLRTPTQKYYVRCKVNGSPVYSCDCPGFRLRKGDCLHVREAAKRGITTWQESPTQDPAAKAIEQALLDAGFDRWAMFREYGGPELGIEKLAKALRKHWQCALPEAKAVPGAVRVITLED